MCFSRTKYGTDQIWLDQIWDGPNMVPTKYGPDQKWVRPNMLEQIRSDQKCLDQICLDTTIFGFFLVVSIIPLMIECGHKKITLGQT